MYSKKMTVYFRLKTGAIVWIISMPLSILTLGLMVHPEKLKRKLITLACCKGIQLRQLMTIWQFAQLVGLCAPQQCIMHHCLMKIFNMNKNLPWRYHRVVLMPPWLCQCITKTLSYGGLAIYMCPPIQYTKYHLIWHLSLTALNLAGCVCVWGGGERLCAETPLVLMMLRLLMLPNNPTKQHSLQKWDWLWANITDSYQTCRDFAGRYWHYYFILATLKPTTLWGPSLQIDVFLPATIAGSNSTICEQYAKFSLFFIYVRLGYSSINTAKSSLSMMLPLKDSWKVFIKCDLLFWDIHAFGMCLVIWNIWEH